MDNRNNFSLSTEDLLPQVSGRPTSLKELFKLTAPLLHSFSILFPNVFMFINRMICKSIIFNETNVFWVFFWWFQTQTRSTNHFQTGQSPQAESARIPSIGKPQSGGGADGQTEEMLKVLRGILNKLTPERFEGLVKQVDELKIDNEESLKAVIELIFKKAVSEQSYSMAYAKMCHHMKGVNF